MADFATVTDIRGVNITSENFAMVERLAHWQAAESMAQAQPWLGVGIGNYAVAYPKFALLNWPVALGHAHMIYLNVLAETGVAGWPDILSCGWLSLPLQSRSIAAPPVSIAAWHLACWARGRI